MKTTNVLTILTLAIGLASCTKTAEDYIGGYEITDDCRGSYTIAIREAQNGDHVIIDNFMNRLDYSEATVDGKTISFTDDEVWSVDHENGIEVRYTVTANGTLKKDKIEWSYHYELSDGSLSEDCTATATRE